MNRRPQPPRGHGGDVHDSKIETAAVTLQVPRDHQCESGVQKRTGNVTWWQDAEMVERWVASAWLLTEKHFRKVIGHENLSCTSPTRQDGHRGFAFPSR